MTNRIKIKEVANKLSYDYKTPIVCGNTNYEIEFEFSEVWANVEKKTAIFLVDGKKIFVEFTGNICKMPSFPNAYFCMLTLTSAPGNGEFYNTNELVINLTQNDLGTEVQLMDPFVGYYSRLLEAIKKFERGEFSAKKAENSESSKKAEYASHAKISDTATYAETSGTSNHSATSDNATHSATSDSATYAETSGSATRSAMSDNATHSVTSDKATHSATSDSATYAETSGNSAHSDTSDFSTISNRSETQVSLTGDEEISGEKNFIGDLKKKGQTVLNSKEISNENILLNGDFSINQRELTEYLGENIYSVDRWKLGDSLSKAVKDENEQWTFSITGATSVASRNLFMQTVEHFKNFSGQKVTASIKYKNLVEDVSGTTILSISDGETISEVVLSSNEEISKLTHLVSSSATTLIVKVSTTSSGKNCSISPIWCKLEVGENSTAFMPRQPSEELWLCQRYFQNLKLEGQTACVVSVAMIQPVVILNNSLRGTPTITMVQSPLIWGDAKSYSSKNFYYKSLENNHFSFLLQANTTAEGATSLSTQSMKILRNGKMTLDAEIY